MLDGGANIIDDDEIKVISKCDNFLEYVRYMKDNTREYALEYDLKLLARFLSINIYIFTPNNDTDEFEINNTRTVRFLWFIPPYDMECSKKPYITVVKNGSHYEPAMTTASGCVWLLSNSMQQKADKCMNSYRDPNMDDNTVFCKINPLPRLPRVRQQDIGDIIRMRDVFCMRPEQYFTDAVLTGFLGILNYNHKNTMDFANTFFLDDVKRSNYNPDYVSRLMRTRIKDKTIFDLENYFVLNHIPPVHWGIIHVCMKRKTISCYDGYHMAEDQKYREVKKCLNILADKHDITEYKDCTWRKKSIDKHMYPRQVDGWNCGTFVAMFAYHMTLNGYLPKATECNEYLTLFRKFMFSCFDQTKENNKATMTSLD